MWADPASKDHFVVSSAFDVRRFEQGGTRFTDLTVRYALRDGSGTHDLDAVWQRARRGIEDYYNRTVHELPDGRRLHVSVERVAVDEDPHRVVDIKSRGQQPSMDQSTWWPDVDPVAYAHEVGHQLGLRDEYDPKGEEGGRANIPGSLMGDFWQQVSDGLAQGGLRDRHLHLLHALIGDPTDTTNNHPSIAFGRRPGRGGPRCAPAPARPAGWSEGCPALRS
ncbi:hypothetical protein OG422_25540 [Streptomyces sp. NBC_01525]|uniref:hypothetical protein n=1 Tax=Streptomyces sp. NBC_01525 TaxID=2903893 RepID=UPI00386939DA